MNHHATLTKNIWNKKDQNPLTDMNKVVYISIMHISLYVYKILKDPTAKIFEKDKTIIESLNKSKN